MSTAKEVVASAKTMTEDEAVTALTLEAARVRPRSTVVFALRGRIESIHESATEPATGPVSASVSATEEMGAAVRMES